MKDNRTEELKASADPAEAEGEIAAAELGKFKDVKALAEAYRALEAEFTRRSQKLRELEAKKETDAPVKTVNAEFPSQDAKSNIAAPAEGTGKTDEVLKPANVTEARPTAENAASKLTDEERYAVIEEYLNSVITGRGVPFVAGGGAVAAERRSPKNMREAGVLAKNFFNKKEDK